MAAWSSAALRASGDTVICPPDGGVVHATAIAWDNDGAWRGVLLLGPSGAGKSTLALEAMAMGARLVADDRVILTRDRGRIRATAPAAIAGLIEARGIGLLRAPPVACAAIAVVADLAAVETDRLPPPRFAVCCGRELPLVRGKGRAGLVAALRQLVLFGRVEPATLMETG